MVARRSAPARRTPAKAAPKPVQRSARADVTVYATKPATPYHKAFAKWITTEVGFDPESASSKRAAFLRGVSIATAARPAFTESDFLEEWREATGESKRGPKSAPVEEAPTRRAKPKPAPVDDDDFDDEDVDVDDIDDEEIDDEDFDDDEDVDDDEDDDDEEPAPAPRKRAPAKRTAAAPAKRAPAKAATRRAKPVADEDDDEFVF